MHRQIPVVQINDAIHRLDEYDALIDVRSPSEFQIDHIPSALNLYVLNDLERAKIGTIYKEIDSFSARKLGGGFTSKNIAAHIFELQNKSKTWKPLIYCWRGGQRSGSMALVMQEIGWPVTVLEGGYKSFRRYIQNELGALIDKFKLLVLTGQTGAGKTRLLEEMQNRGLQVLNLEKLAHHRGSILGQDPQRPQPSQKAFETGLFFAFSKLNPNPPVWIESESSKIGNLHLPKALFAKIGIADAILLTCPIRQRTNFLLQDYSHLISNSAVTKTLITQLSFRQKKSRVDSWNKLITEGNWKKLAYELLFYHYDPAYAISQRRLKITKSIALKNAAVFSDKILEIDQMVTKEIKSIHPMG